MRYFLAVFALLLVPLSSHAELVINEVMYDASGADTDREWIELHNTGASPVTIVTGSGSGSWRIVDSSAHILNPDSSNTTITAGGYAVVAKNASAFKVDYPSFAGLLFVSAINLPNTTASIAIRDAEQNNLDLISYSSDRGANGDGNSLSRSGSSWTTGPPSPGTANGGSGSPAVTPVAPSPDSSGASVIIVDSPYIDRQTRAFNIKASTERNGVVNSPVYFMASTDPDSYESQARFTWSFGDGSTGAGQSVQHAYLLPGKYVATVRAAGAPGFVVANIGVNISDFPIEFGDHKNGTEGYVTLINKSGGDMYLTGLSLTMGAQIYNFPADFVLGSGELKLPARVTGLALYEGKTIELRDSYGKIILSKKIIPAPIVSIKSESAVVPITPIIPIIVPKNTIISPTPEVISVAPALVIERKSGFFTSLLALPRRIIGSIMGI